MANQQKIKDHAKDAFYVAMEQCPKNLYDSVKKAASKVECFYCMDLQVVYKERGGMFSNMDSRGSFDMIKCYACTGEMDKWVKCMHEPEKEVPGIRLVERRERLFGEKETLDVGQHAVGYLVKQAKSQMQ